MSHAGKVIACSGFFGLGAHVGHIEMMAQAKELVGPDGKLVIIVNNDNQVFRKKGHLLLPEQERLTMVKAIRYVDDAFISIDTDGTVCESIRYAHEKHGVTIFANGGDRHSTETPETPVCRELGIDTLDGLGDKVQSTTHMQKLASGADTGIKPKMRLIQLLG